MKDERTRLTSCLDIERVAFLLVYTGIPLILKVLKCFYIVDIKEKLKAAINKSAFHDSSNLHPVLDY